MTDKQEEIRIGDLTNKGIITDYDRGFLSEPDEYYTDNKHFPDYYTRNELYKINKNKMTKPELLKLLASKSGSHTSQVDAHLDALIEVIREEVLEKGEDVNIPGLGVFKQKLKAAGTARNPGTGETVNTVAKTSVVFKAASAMIKK